MDLSGLIGGLASIGARLPLDYGQMYQQGYAPAFSFYNNQANNAAGMGNAYIGNAGQLGAAQMNNNAQLGAASMGLYGNLAGQQSAMYQSELPFQMQQAQFNSLAPVLGGLLGNLGFDGMPAKISPISMQFNRPDVMSGYQGAVDGAYDSFNKASTSADTRLRGAYDQGMTGMAGYDQRFGETHADMLDKMPAAPYMRQGGQQPPRPAARPGQLPPARAMPGGPSAYLPARAPSPGGWQPAAQSAR